MSIEQKIKEILAESQKAEDAQEELVSEEVATEEVVAEEIVAEEAEEEVVEEETVSEEAEEIEEATDVNDPSKGSEQNADNKKNDVDKEEIGGKSKSANVVTKDASAPEAMPKKLDMKEDVDALVEGEELSEEFKEKAATIFEAAVMNRVKQEVAKLDEAYAAQVDERVEQFVEGLVDKVDGYLDYVVEQWIEQNEIALESGMKSEILESFVGGLKSLFEDHNIDVPEEKFDMVESLQVQIEELNGHLNEQMASNVELHRELSTYQAAQVVSGLAEGLTETDKEKFHTLVEELEFDSVEAFRKKAQTIRESYFTSKATAKPVVESIVTDTPVQLSEEKAAPKADIDPSMARYLSALNNIK